LRHDALNRVADIEDKTEVKLQSFHAKIGRWNTTFVDSIRVQFSDPKDFCARWAGGLLDSVEQIERDQRIKYNGNIYQSTPQHLLIRYLKDPLLREYIVTFLKRNFYRNFLARTRAKPGDHLWSLWFGSGDHVWGLIIAPAYRGGRWSNDVSGIRRADYHYWTIGHVLSTGLIDPDSKTPLTWTNTEQFLAFYRSVLKRESNSIYEKAFADRYIAYVAESEHAQSEPLLIPEFRYAGLEREHEHRLDYTIFNSHTMEMTGFELSPASTHMAISGMRKESKTQTSINLELTAKWEKEMTKRNEYFQTYSIPVVTFTDTKLQNLDGCFETVKERLSARNPHIVDIADAMHRIDAFDLH